LRNMTALDGTGVHALESFAERVKASGRALVACGARKQPAKLIQASELPDLIGRENIVPHVDAAIQRAEALYEAFGGVGKQLAKGLSWHSM
jgi:SulP family sulfate permease